MQKNQQFFLDLIKQSNERVLKENKKYYYIVDDFKIDNVYLCVWYEQTFNTFNSFVSPENVKKIKKVLEENKSIDLDYNYDVEYLRELRKNNRYLQLFLSGGVDSCNLLTNCIENNIFIDEIVSIYTGDSIDLPENIEIKSSAIKYAELYKGKYGKFTLHNSNRDFLKKHFKDPSVFFKTPEIGPGFPFLRQSYHTLEKSTGPKIFGPNKPQLLYYKNNWYVICLDEDLNGYSYVDQLVMMSYEPDSIKSLIKSAIIYRNYLIENRDIIKNKTQFFRPNRNDLPKYYNRTPLIFESRNLYKNHDVSGNTLVWAEKDIFALNNIIENQDLELFLSYSKCLNEIICALPNFDFKNKKISHNKICWAINIDTLEIFTQQELIPNGFEE